MVREEEWVALSGEEVEQIAQPVRRREGEQPLLVGTRVRGRGEG